MRDYKNVKVPKRYRTETSRSTVKRAVVKRRASSSERSESRGFIVRFLIAIVIVAGGYFGWTGYKWFVHAEIFQVSGVDVNGVTRIPEDEIREIGSIFEKQNVFLVNIDSAVRQVREHPWVKDVRIYRRLPNRISMTIIERVPVGILDTGSARYFIDGDSVVMGKVTKQDGEPHRLPLILAHGCRISPGLRVTSAGVSEAMAFLSEIAARKGWQLSEVAVKADSAESLSVLYAGHEFKIGSGAYREKLRRLGEIVADVNERGKDFAYVDLRSERQAAVMVRR